MYKDLPELIVQAANHYPEIGKTILGVRHCDEFMQEQIEDFYAYPKLPKEIQGFVTNKRRFVDRREAMQIAIKEGQIRRLVGSQTLASLHEHELFSENLY